MSEKDLKAVALEYLKQAKGGDLRAITDLIDRLDGKPKQTTEIEGNLGLPVQVVDPGDFPEKIKERMGE